MIKQLVAVLEQRFTDLTAEEIAEILWLTLQQLQSSSAQLSSPISNQGVSSDPLVVDSGLPAVTISPPPPAEFPNKTSTAPSSPMAGLTTKQTQTKTQAASDLEAPLAIPDSPSLRRSLDLLKALRPLIRLVPSAETKYLDVPATVKAIAETDLWLLQERPVLEPWLELAIVVDATPSMIIWQRTILNLRRVLAQSGVFRDVRMWSLEPEDSGKATVQSRNLTSAETSGALDTSEDDSSKVPVQGTAPSTKFCVRSGFGVATATQPPCRPQELLDPNGRRLILVISDCVNPQWDTQDIRDLLLVWANHGPMALVQMLPESLWSRTALSQVTQGQMVGSTPGQSSQSLSFVRRDRWRRKTPEGVKVPVLTLEPAVASRWSQMVAGKSTSKAPGLIFSPVNVQQLVPRQSADGQSIPAPLSSKQRLEQFRNFSSPMARRLAGLLAACPEVNLPIVRMVQAAMLSDSEQVHVAEVLFGGLFKPHTDITAHTPADQVPYVFHDGLRPLVQDTVPPDQSFTALSTWIQRRFGYSLEDFRAYVTPGRIEEIKPFAGVLLDVLKRRGSQYSEVISCLEAEFQPRYTSIAALTQQEALTSDYQILTRQGRSEVVVMAIHGGNLQPGTTEIADQVAGNLHSFYAFVSLKPEIDQTLYLSSTQFDDPTALEMVRKARIVLSIHGCKGETAFIRVGGADRDRVETIIPELTNELFVVTDDRSAGTHPDNICNRGLTGRGVQIEVSRGLRNQLVADDGQVLDVRRLRQLVSALQRGLAATTPVEALETTTVPEPPFPDLQTLDFTTAQLVEPSTVQPFPPLQMQEVEVVTIALDDGQDTAAVGVDWQLIAFEVATLERNAEQQRGGLFGLFRSGEQRSQWVIRKQRQQRVGLLVEPLGNTLALEMLLIPGGNFVMGSPADEPERNPAEGPQHEVELDAFMMGRYPVTQAQWSVVAAMPQINRGLEPNPSKFKGDQRPVEQVSWYDAVEFCDRLNNHTDDRYHYRLPSEAEWEYACRTGTTTPFHVGEMLTTDLANYHGNYTYNDGPNGEYRHRTTPVDQFRIANAFGLCDMHGNVWEWCEDHWHENYKGAPTDGSDWLSENEETARVVRGGSWYEDPGSCRSASRSYGKLDSRDHGVGFRVVCSTPRTQ